MSAVGKKNKTNNTTESELQEGSNGTELVVNSSTGQTIWENRWKQFYPVASSQTFEECKTTFGKWCLDKGWERGFVIIQLSLKVQTFVHVMITTLKFR